MYGFDGAVCARSVAKKPRRPVGIATHDLSGWYLKWSHPSQATRASTPKLDGKQRRRFFKKNEMRLGAAWCDRT